MRQYGLMLSEEFPQRSWLWHGNTSLTILVLLALGLTIGLPGSGVIGAFVIAIAVSLISRRRGSFRDMGFRRPASWPQLLGTTLLYGLGIQMVFMMIVEPGLSHATGQPVDVSMFDAARGDFVNFLILMGLGWVVGGFLEELTFRGFIVGRVRWLLGSGAVAKWFAVLVAAVPFGIAHLYQGLTGVIATGMIGFLLGAVYVCHRFNLWYSIFTHGFINTVGITAIYFNADRSIQQWIF
jgi:CAAX protease family protein